eukprot:CAMPEP_0118851666 /NCGR_PEP_ID=MMETSP1163-20130328/1020_2 /TAXON_ID=124430 /ORGANISM="Phaeomonas parva, Strain CCMP2877" /LENGTH=86 /DNA_ID=CAMNT_0006784041 /DNA_START=401 /DNA_END=658 /DNA_ORIENTATION=-
MALGLGLGLGLELGLRREIHAVAVAGAAQQALEEAQAQEQRAALVAADDGEELVAAVSLTAAATAVLDQESVDALDGRVQLRLRQL